MYSLAFVQLDPAGKVIFHMHIQTKTDSKTLGGPLNVNKGLLRTKERKEKRKGGEREEMGKTNISEGMAQIKGILFSKTTEATSLQNPEKSLQTGNQFCFLKEGVDN